MSTRRADVRVTLPAQAKAPGFRDAMTRHAGYSVRFERNDTGVVAPDDSSELLSAHRLIRPGESRRRMWENLEAHPRRDYVTEHLDRAQAEVDRMVSLGTPEGLLGG